VWLGEASQIHAEFWCGRGGGGEASKKMDACKTEKEMDLNMNRGETGCEDGMRIQLVQKRVQWLALVFVIGEHPPVLLLGYWLFKQECAPVLFTVWFGLICNVFLIIEL
jgi:hypothetical protein